MTRFDRIKNMNIEEMARCLGEQDILTYEVCKAVDKCPYMNEDGDMSNDVDCTGCVKKWLESEEI